MILFNVNPWHRLHMIYENFCLLHPFIRHFPRTHPLHSQLHLSFVEFSRSCLGEIDHFSLISIVVIWYGVHVGSARRLHFSFSRQLGFLDLCLSLSFSIYLSISVRSLVFDLTKTPSLVSISSLARSLGVYLLSPDEQFCREKIKSLQSKIQARTERSKILAQRGTPDLEPLEP